MPRMRILSATEQEQFENPPTFDTFERKKFFHFPKTVLGTAKTFRKPIYQICFLISFGYFKVVKRFFSPYDFHPCDIDYVARQLDLQTDSFNAAAYANRTRQRHELIILEFYGFKRFDRTAERSIIVEIERMVQSQLKPKLIFFQCVDCMISKHIQIPNYHALSELILSALNQRKRDLSAIIDKKLTPHTRELLEQLFIQGVDGTATEDIALSPAKTMRYRLTLLKKLSQSTRPTKVRKCLEDLTDLAELHVQLTPVLTAMNLDA